MTLQVLDLQVFNGNKNIIGPLSFEHSEGSLAIMGPSGSGKTTVAKSIVALNASLRLRGEIRYRGQCLQRDQHTLIPTHQRRFGFIPQQCSPWPHLSVKKALALAQRFAPEKDPIDLAQLAYLFGLTALLEHKPHQLSGGQKQRLLIASALIARPEILIFDEAFFALDIVAKMELISLIKEIQIQWGFSIIFITHDVAEARAIADQILLISDGKKLWQGEAAKLSEAPFQEQWNPLRSPLLNLYAEYIHPSSSSTG